jgi:hypothetical protein
LNKPRDIQAENLSRSEREKVNPNCFEDSTFTLQKNPSPIAVGGGGRGRQCARISKHGMNILGKNCKDLGTQLLTVYGKKNLEVSNQTDQRLHCYLSYFVHGYYKIKKQISTKFCLWFVWIIRMVFHAEGGIEISRCLEC